MSSSSVESRSMGSLGVMEVVSPGIFGTTVVQNGKPIHLRMELLTAENEKRWGLFCYLTTILCESGGGPFAFLVRNVCRNNSNITYSKWVQDTGFSEEEHDVFLKKILNAKKRTAGKIYDMISQTDLGSQHMCTERKDFTLISGASDSIYKNGRYIIYATRNPKFIIPPVKSTPDNTLKNWIKSYKDVLISAGTDFSCGEMLFHTRGIFRNPYWVLQGKYAGLSMLLHGFSGVVAQTFFPKKERLKVAPIGSMMCIFQKALQRGEATFHAWGCTTIMDVLDIKVDPHSPESGPVLITVPALVRIFNAIIAQKDS